MEEVSFFAQKVYSICRKIPRGKVTTYAEIARQLNTKGYQAIGQALRCNPYAPNVPCHRVVKSDGSIGGFKGKKEGKEIAQKMGLLQQERILIVNGKIALEKYSHRF